MSVIASAIPWAPAWVCLEEAPPEWVQAKNIHTACSSDGDDLIDSEEQIVSPDSPYPFTLPENAIDAARKADAPPNQIRQAEELQARGLKTKAKRQAVCRVYGRRCDCSNTACRFRGYQRFRCKNRYCRSCGRLAYNALFKKYLGLLPVAEKLSDHAGTVIAKIDFTSVNLGRMPTREEVRTFNRCIKRFLRALERARGLSRADYGLAYCDEFGGDNMNLHAHGVYVGPVLPRQWFGKGAKLSEMWKEACRGTVFHGSFIISLKEAGGFSRGLGHALKYSGKFLSEDTARLADLELAFNGVRRVHTLAGFYNRLPKEEQKESGSSCPECGSALNEGDCYVPIRLLRREGRSDLEEARRFAGRVRVFRGPPGRTD